MTPADNWCERRASYAQERIWLTRELTGEGSTDNRCLIYAVPESVDMAAFERALATLIERHEALRTVFATRDGVLVQSIQPPVRLQVPLFELTGESPEEREEDMRRRVETARRRPFDLRRGPLIRCEACLSAPSRLSVLISLDPIIADTASLAVLDRELDALCAGHAAGGRIELPPLEAQFADYADEQRRAAATVGTSDALEYWRRRLEGAPPVIELPLDRARTARPQAELKTRTFAFSAVSSGELAGLATRTGATPFAVLLAAFKALLFRMSGQQDIVIATPAPDRSRAEFRDLIGCFVNSLLLRDSLASGLTFAALVAAVSDTADEALAYQDLPFERVLESVNPPRSLSYNALYQASFAFTTEEEAATIGGLALPGSELSLTVSKRGAALHGSFDYRSDLIDETTIDRLIGCYRCLLDDAIARPDAEVGDLRLLDDASHEQIVNTWNGWELDYPADQCLHGMIERQAERTPGAVAVVFEGERLSYAELNARANRLAHRLLSLGAGTEAIVGIMLDQSLDMIVAMLATLKARGAYMPLEPSLPNERLAYMVGDARPLVVLTHRKHASKIAAAGGTPLVLDADHASGSRADNPGLPQTSRALAYVIYTSGSTGRPKGVMIEHRSALHHLWGMKLQYGFGPEDRFIQLHPYNFDVSMWEFFMPLVSGGRVVMIRPDGHKDLVYLIDLIVREGVTFACFLPSVLQLLLEEPGVGALNRCVRWIICGAETLWPDQVARFFEILTARLDNAYGPTETTVHNSWYHCHSGPQPAIIPIGRPMPGNRIYIVDARMNPVPIGVSGEICIGGDALARGYLNDPGITGEKFIPDPFCATVGARLYKTGDIGRFRADGNIEFQGRRDHQIKLRGFRIELGEVNQVLKRHPAVRDCISVLRDDFPGERRIVCYCAMADGSVSQRALFEFLGDSLPEHMLPSAIVQMSALPLRETGKIDVAALPAPPAGGGLACDYVPPRTASERRLAAMWQELLDVPQIGAFDNFFALGGHSLLAICLMARLRAETPSLPIQAIFRRPVLADLAELLEAIDGTEEELDRPFPNAPASVALSGATCP